MTPITRNRWLRAAVAFTLTLATAGLVWQSGRSRGWQEAVPPAPTLNRAALTLPASPPPPPNAFTDPVTAPLSADEFSRLLSELKPAVPAAATDTARRKLAARLARLARDAHFQGKGDGSLSLEGFQQALRLTRKLENPTPPDFKTEAFLLADLSMTQLLLGQPDQAEASLRQALSLEKKAEVTLSEAADLRYRLGDLLRLRGRYREAAASLDRALRLQQKAGNEGGQADCLRALGVNAFENGSPALARQLWNQSALMFEKNGPVESRAAVLGHLGDVALSEGDTDTARRLYTEGLTVWQERKHNFWTGRFLVRLARVALADREVAHAGRLADQGHRLLQASNGPVVVSSALLVKGEIARHQGKTAEAASLLKEALRLRQTLGYAYGIAECQKALGIAK